MTTEICVTTPSLDSGAQEADESKSGTQKENGNKEITSEDHSDPWNGEHGGNARSSLKLHCGREEPE